MRNTSGRADRIRLPEDPKVLQDAIVLMESCLQTLDDGDCAYEKAMCRFYEQQLALHRARLYLHRPPLSGQPVRQVGDLSGRV